MKIVALGGSLRRPSYTYDILETALKLITERKIATDLIDLRSLKLPFCDGSTTYPQFPDVAKLRTQIQSATGILLATPEYHGSISGVLKNALDLIEEEHIKGKVVGLIAVVGGVHSTNAINTLRIICRQLHCWVLPEQLIIPHVKESFDRQGRLVDVLLHEKLISMVDHFVKAVHRFRED